MTPAIRGRLQRVRTASRALRDLSTESKNRVLRRIAAGLQENQTQVLAANRKDLGALDKKQSDAFRDRLLLNETRIDQIIGGLNQVASLVDPAGEIVEERTLKNGLHIRRERQALGVILMIFESRPNVAVEAFSLAFKAGNAVILKGGKESMHTTGALYRIISGALRAERIPVDALWGIETSERKLVGELLKARSWIDVVVPRGGERLIEFVIENSRIPVIKNDRGLCHVYVEADADLEMAANIVVNSKTQRPGVCNSMETLLVHQRIAAKLLPALHALLHPFDLEWRGCPATLKILRGMSGVKKAGSEDFDTEYLSYKMNCRVVRDLSEAIDHIEIHGSRHSEAIVTRSEVIARKFEAQVDAAAVYWNASTRFTDGFELGLGGELGISTQKLHVRGPVGLRELTSVRWVIEGNGQIRGNS